VCCDHLVCASCTRPVADGHCGVCRAARARLHPSAGVPMQMLLVLAAVIALAALLSAHLAR
jgi:hypothetical protein